MKPSSRAVPSSFTTARPWWCTTSLRRWLIRPQAGPTTSSGDALHRHLHQAASTGDRPQSPDRDCRDPGDPRAQRAPVSSQRERLHHRHYGLRRCQCRAGPRLHHHAAGALHRRRRRNRLPRIREPPGRLHHSRTSPSQSRRQQGTRRGVLQSRPGARRSATLGRDSRHQHRVRRQPVRLRLSELLLRVSAAERDHRLSDAHRSAASVLHRRGAARRPSGRAYLRHAHLAQTRPHGGAQRESFAGSRGARVQQLSGGGGPNHRDSSSR